MIEIMLPEVNARAVFTARRPDNSIADARFLGSLFNYRMRRGTFALFVCSAVLATTVLAAADSGLSGIIVAMAALITSLGGIGGLGVMIWKQRAEGLRTRERETRAAIANEVNLKAVESRFAEFKEQSISRYNELRSELDTEKQRVKNQESDLRELRRRLQTHVSLITEISILLKDGDGGRPKIEELIVAWQKRQVWISGDTP